MTDKTTSDRVGVRSKQEISIEELRDLLKKHVNVDIKTFTSFDDAELFAEDISEFLCALLRSTARLNPQPVAKAARRQFEAKPQICKKFGDATAAAFSLVKLKSRRPAPSMKRQSTVMKHSSTQ